MIQPAAPERPREGGPTLAAKAAIVLLAAAVIAIGSLPLTRPGYSVDEEFTVFAVRGIQQHGLPLLPSGLLYDRGLAYSYLVAGAQGAQGARGAQDVLVPARLVSLICAALVLWLVFKLVRAWTGANVALFASVLVAVSVPFWATATSARFYAPFLAAFVSVVIAVSTLRTSCTLLTLCTIAILSAVARWTHELAFLCAAIPVVCWLLSRGDRRRWLYGTIAVAGGLLVGQAIILALHAAAPSSGETMVQRFFVWQVLNLFERPSDRQFMIPLVVMVIAWLAAPRRAWAISVVSLSIAAMILAYSLARATNAAPLSFELTRSVLADGSRYPLDMFWHIARTMPMTLFLALAGLALRVAGAGYLRQGSGAQGGEWRFGERALHGLWIGWVLWFGVIESGITTNYLLLPTVFLMMAIAVDASAMFRKARVPALAVVLLIVTFDQWGLAPFERLDAARPTTRADAIDEIRAGLEPGDRVACTDELGCLMLVGRIDRWLALDDYVRERFIVQRADGAPGGVYTGVPAAFRPGDLFDANADGTLPDRVVIVDIFKDYPIGNSRSWLPRAIEKDGLQVVPLLETPQLRVLRVSPTERVATGRVAASP